MHSENKHGVGLKHCREDFAAELGRWFDEHKALHSGRGPGEKGRNRVQTGIA
jgi:hypothetical protein